jgi:hypothetical protein
MLARTSSTLRRTGNMRVAPALATFVVVVSACAADGESRAPESADNPPLAAVSIAGNGVATVRHAEGNFIAAVRTEGSGCPAGTVNTRISDDGEVFTTTFSAYDLRLSPSDREVTRNCRLAINLRSPDGPSFSVQSISYLGYAFLEQDVRARQTAGYAFRDQKVGAEGIREDLVGPYDSDFLFRDDVSLNEEAWTPCDRERELLVSTELRMQNGAVPRFGYINMAAVNGQSQVTLKVASHRCDPTRAQGWTTGPFTTRRDALQASFVTSPDQARGVGASSATER